MIINCKNCNVNYLVSDKSFGINGRNVKCVKCEAVWFQFPLPSKDESLESKLDELPKDLSFNQKHVPVIIERKSKILYMSLSIILLLIVVLLGFYKHLANLPSDNDIEIKNINISRNIQEKQVTLSYELYNNSNTKQIFNVIVKALDKDQKTLQVYDIESEQTIEQEEKQMLSDKLTDLPDDTKSLIMNIKKKS